MPFDIFIAGRDEHPQVEPAAETPAVETTTTEKE